LAGIQPLLDRTHRPQQSGFTAGRSTIDAILALRLLSEIHCEFNRPQNVAYLDIKSAFDYVDRTTTFWNALHGKGVPDIIICLITALREHTGACIGVGHQRLPSIFTTSVVRQGCILAAIVFCVAIDWIIEH